MTWAEKHARALGLAESVCNGWGPTYKQRQDLADDFASALISAKAEIERLRNINSNLCKSHNALNLDGAKWQGRAEKAEAEVERLTRKQDATWLAIKAVLHHCQADGTLDRSLICDYLNAALQPAAIEEKSGEYDNAPTNPVHGGKIWEGEPRRGTATIAPTPAQELGRNECPCDLEKIVDPQCCSAGMCTREET